MGEAEGYVAARCGVKEPVNLGEVLSPIELPCGRILSNRLVKASMYEHLASLCGGPPNASLFALYAVWAKGGWGMVITGNVQVSRSHLSLGGDVVVPDHISEKGIAGFRQLAFSIKGCDVEGTSANDVEVNVRPLAIMQLNHAGRQSPNLVGGRWPFFQQPVSASATRVGDSSNAQGTDNLSTRLSNAVLFQRSRAMEEQDVRKTVEAFVRGARLAYESGFDGIQIHGAHGYLVAQFISRKTNLRTDKYAAPLSFLREIVEAIRGAVPRNFVVGIKLNSADYTTGGFSESEGAEHLAEIARWQWDGAGIDFIEISGGDYESPDFMLKSSPRQAFFESFSCIAVETVEQEFNDSDSGRRPPLIMLTGGLRTRAQLSHVLSRRHAHLLGLARLSVLQPTLPDLLREYYEQGKRLGNENSCPTDDDELWSWETQPSPEPSSPSWWPRLVGAGVGMAWYVVGMRRLALARELPHRENRLSLILEMYFGTLWDSRSAWAFLVITVSILSVVTSVFS